MADHVKSIKKPRLGTLHERRKYPRKSCFFEANYMVQNRWHKGSIKNISDGGAFILSIGNENFFPSAEIFLVTRGKILRERLRGKISWVGLQGMGVEFQTTELKKGE